MQQKYGRVGTVAELGAIIRAYRKSHHLTLKKISDITNVSMRFLSELERGKESAEIGKALAVINKLGLELILQPRGYSQPISTVQRSKEG